MAEDWWRGSVTYQIYPRSFQDSDGDGVGDLRGITRRLPLIADLGVDAESVGLSAAWSAVVDMAARPPRTAGAIVTDEAGSGATALVEFLASRKFI